jgi:hypothetical protein
MATKKLTQRGKYEKRKLQRIQEIRDQEKLLDPSSAIRKSDRGLIRKRKALPLNKNRKRRGVS